MDASVLSLLPRVFISMAVVIGVMWLAARILKNRQMPGIGGGFGKSTKGSAKPAVVQVIGRQGLGKGTSVTVVQAGDKTLVLGVTDSTISLLAELQNDVQETASDAQPVDITVDGEGDAQWTGVPASLAGLAGAGSADQAWKGLLSQVRERTVRRSL